MGKGQNLTKRQQKERDEEEKAKIAALQQKAAAMGLTTYRNEEIIDDVDPELVQESFANSLLAWIPYTTAWRKAQIATEALDNLKRINNERKIARKLFAMTKIGQHEEALRELMSEVESDFAYFNKLKLKMESEGKVAYEPVGVNPFANLGRQNRLKRAADAGVDIYAVKPAETKSEKKMLALEDHQPVRKRELICSWKGQDKNGLALRCGNIAMDTEKIPFKVRLCPYHMTRCIAIAHSGSVDPPLIQIPNSQALCSRCYQQQMGHRPGKIKSESAPGVVLATSLLQSLAVTKPRTREEIQAAAAAAATDNGKSAKSQFGSQKRSYEGTSANFTAAKAVLMAALRANSTFGKSKSALKSVASTSARTLDVGNDTDAEKEELHREIPRSARQLLSKRGSSVRKIALKSPSKTAFDAMKSKQKSARISSFDLLRKTPSKAAINAKSNASATNIVERAEDDGAVDEDDDNAKRMEDTRKELLQSLGYVNPFGKVKLVTQGGKGDGKAKKEGGGGRDKRTICQWKPDLKNPKERDWICVGKPLRHPETGKRMKFCAYHTRVCVCPHPDIPSSLITVPNSFAFCVLHHTAQLGKAPEIPVFPYPNMRLRHTVQLEPSRHWAAPKRNPVPHIVMKEFVEPAKPVTVKEKIFHGAKLALFLWRKFKRGQKAATKIQALYRGYRLRNVHLPRKWDRDVNRRVHAAVVLQSYARMKRDIVYVDGIRRLYNLAATMIEKLARGFICRRRERKRRAAIRIQNFFKLNYFVKCRDAVLMVVQLRRMMLKRVNAVVTIQCAVRRFIATRFVANKRLRRFIENRAAKRIQRLVRYFLLRNAIFNDDPRVIDLDERFDMLYPLRARRLARMIYALYQTRYSRRARYDLYNQRVVLVQKIVRGYVGRAIARKLSALRISLRTWCEPQFAMLFMSEFLTKRMTFKSSRIRNIDVAIRGLIPTTPKKPPPARFVRLFLPEEVQDDRTAKMEVYEEALKNWYLSQDAPIQHAEIRDLMKAYRDPGTGEILVSMLDDYISLHPRPCRVHGRKICSKCVFLRECKMNGCSCKLFVPTVGEEGICDNCYHGPMCHRKCPQQLSGDPEINDESLLGILETIKSPDFDPPPNIKGVSIKKAICKPPDPDLKKYKQLLKAKRADLTRTMSEQMATTTQSRLAKSQLSAEKAMESHDYWGQKPVTMLKPDPNAIFGVEAAYGLTTPRSKLSEDNYWEGFWRAVAKNPNKNIRDYEEKFEHNMPVALVQDDALVYTLEGPKVYVNILMQLVKLEYQIDEDDSDFLRLVMDNILMFERHWRKMVKDLREGVLNRNLNADAMVRDLFTSISMPRPALAARLDMTLRRLGFHKKNIGSDVNPHPYAKLRRRPASSTSRSRRPSLPITPGHDSTRNLSDLIRDTAAVDSFSGGPKSTSRSRSRSRGSPTRQFVTGGQPERRGRGENRERGRSRSRSTSLTRDDRRGSLTSTTSSVSVASSTGAGMVTPGRSVGFKELTKEAHDALSVDSSKISATGGAGGTGGDAVSLRSPGKRRSGSPSHLLMSQSARLSPLRTQSRSSQLGDGSRQLPAMSMSQTRPLTPLSAKQMSVFRLSQAMQASSLDDFKNKEEEERRRGPSRRSGSNKRRRGSETDTYVPTEVHELHAISRRQAVAPVAHLHRIVQNAAGDRYICPFPACGKSFRSKDATFAHIRTHEQRNKLQTAVPLQDSLLTAFWPADSPWVTAPQFKERSLPPGSLACPVEGCKAVFATTELLKSHVRVFHAKTTSLSGHTAGYFSFNEYLFTVPPTDPPSEAPLQFCPLHVLPFGRCTTCLEIQSNPDIPKPPLKFYGSATYNFAAKLSFMEGVTGKPAHKSMKAAVAKMEPAILSASDRNRRIGVYVKEGASSGRRGTALEWKGTPVAMLLDRNDDGWVAVRTLLGYMDAVSRNLKLSGDFDKFHEVVLSPEGEVRWVRMDCIARTFDFRVSTKDDFQQLMNSQSISKKDSYFLRTC